MKRLTILLALGASLASMPAAAQTALTQTTLAAAVGSGTTRSGLNQSYSTTVSLASATGVTQAVNGSPVTVLYVDGEAMSVLTTVTGQTTVFNVLRGQFGTPVEDHASGAVVYVQNVSPTNGGFAGSGGLEVSDPPAQGNCSASGTAGTPWINMVTGQQFICGSTFTPTGAAISSWVPASVRALPGENSPSTVFSAASYTNATTTFSNVPGLSFSVQANRNYTATCHITWQGSAATSGPKYQFTGPGSPTGVAIGATSAVTATTFTNGSATAFSSSIANAGTITTATNFTDTVTLGLVNGANSGIVQLQAAANGSGTLTIQPGSYCIVQ